jgi:4-aminobutyrate aminotransferase-like enzyme
MDLRQSVGKSVVDFRSGTGGGDVGWAARAIERALEDFRPEAHEEPMRRRSLWAELAHAISAFVPGELQEAFAASGGDEAVELAISSARAVTGRSTILAIEGARYGDVRLEPPLDRRAAIEAERILRTRDVAAFVMEPIAIGLGVMIPDEGFAARVQELCRKHGTIFVVDEVATGFGRTGKMFAFEHFDLAPDAMCVGRAMAGGYAGMGAMITTERLADAVEKTMSVSSADAWPPASMRAALANLEYLGRHEESRLLAVCEMGAYIQMRLAQMRFGAAATIRGRGLAVAVELEDRGRAERIVERCRERGLLLGRGAGGVIEIVPPLTIDRRTVRRGLDVLERCVAGVARA